ncbi:3-deoxy-7-phosphoheptulonate synthase, partial [Francisella tularensis subsp. holarctica]|nr:3-deoxy-7-phosphoheptulonate synthase [Francisella tularensis subsp. holarctica]
TKLKEQVNKFHKDILKIMRVYFEKTRTTIGWKGFINDPYLDNSYNINKGLRIARNLLSDLTNIGLPCATEFLDVITP